MEHVAPGEVLVEHHDQRLSCIRKHGCHSWPCMLFIKWSHWLATSLINEMSWQQILTRAEPYKLQMYVWQPEAEDHIWRTHLQPDLGAGESCAVCSLVMWKLSFPLNIFPHILPGRHAWRAPLLYTISIEGLCHWLTSVSVLQPAVWDPWDNAKFKYSGSICNGATGRIHCKLESFKIKIWWCLTHPC